MLDAARLVVGPRDIERQAVLVDEHVAEHRVHDATRILEHRLEVLAGSNAIAGGAIEVGDPLARVLDAAGDIGRRLERGPATGDELLGPERGQGVQRGGPLLELGVARVHARVVLDEIAGEADLLRGYPGDGVAPGVARAEVHDPDLQPAEEDGQLALEHHRRPREAGYRLDRTE